MRSRNLTDGAARVLSSIVADVEVSLYGEDDGIYWSSSRNERGQVTVAWFSNGDMTSDPPSAKNLVKCVRDDPASR